MVFQTSRVFCLVLLLAGSAFSQTPDTFVASVNDLEITQKQVDDSVAARIYPLQQQLYAIRKAALENLIVSKILEHEATARGVSIEELRRQLTLGEISVTRAQVEEAYTQNASFFASMSPDEARERLRLDLENQALEKQIVILERKPVFGIVIGPIKGVFRVRIAVVAVGGHTSMLL